MGPYMASPNKEKHTTEGENEFLRYAASEMQGWRNSMEDAHITLINFEPDTSLFGVFDGHGGKEVAKFVERHFVEELRKNKAFQEKQFEVALKENFLRMDELMSTKEGHQELIQIKHGPVNGNNDDNDDQYQNYTSYAGCTANVCLIYKNDIYVANAGDSRSVLGSKSQAIEMSIDHKPDLPEEKSRITNAGGFVNEGRVNGNLNLSRAMGDLEYKGDKDRGVHEQLIIAVPDVRKKTLVAGEDQFLLMGCDGIWETFSNKEMIETVDQGINNGQPLRVVVENLLDKCLAIDTTMGTGCDNMTSIIVQFKQFY